MLPSEAINENHSLGDENATDLDEIEADAIDQRNYRDDAMTMVHDPISHRQCKTVTDKIARFAKKFFCHGQTKKTKCAHISCYSCKFRNALAILTPAVLVHFVWWSSMIANNWFYLFTETSGSENKPRYYMSITMAFGSFIAGATAEGGAAFSFPVMVLALGITPAVARDFSFMIQSVGMVAATYTILALNVAIEWYSSVYVSIGGVAGIIFGLEEVAPRLPPSYIKMYFVVIWSSFAFCLYVLNRNHHRKTYETIAYWEEGVYWKAGDGMLGKWFRINWKAITLLGFGFLGGIFSAMAGSGIDICSFAALTLLFRVDEKIATPTSVILMGINTAVGFAYRQFVMGGMESDAWRFLAVCAPIVALGAPLGSFIASYFHRLTLAGIIYIIDFVQLVGALVVVRPWTTKNTETPLHLTISSIIIFLGGLIFFRLLAHAGLSLLTTEESRNAERYAARILQ